MVELKKKRWHFCPLCERPYSSELHNTTAASSNSTNTSSSPTKDSDTLQYDAAEVGRRCLNAAVPIQSVVCSHILCLSCVQQQASSSTNASAAQEEMDEETTKKALGLKVGGPHVQCPVCWKDNAFDAKKPLISFATCHLLQELERTLLSQESKDNYASDTNVVDPISPEDFQQIQIQQEQQQQQQQPTNDNDSSVISLPCGDIDSNDIPRSENDETLNEGLNDLIHFYEDTTETQQQYTLYDRSNVSDADEVCLALAVPVIESPIAYAELLEPPVPFYIKRRRLLIGFSSALLIIPLVIVLAIKLPVKIRDEKLTSIVMNLTNQSTFHALTVPEKSSLVWILGSDNIQYDPDIDQAQIVQRFIIATFFFSSYYYAVYSIGEDISDDFITKDTDLQKRFIYSSICFSLDCVNLPLDPRDDECNWLPELLPCSIDGDIINITLGK